MNDFICIVKYDLYTNIVGNKLLYGIWMGLAIVLSYLAVMDLADVQTQIDLNWVDVMNEIYMGIEGEAIFEDSQIVQIPVKWFFAHSFMIVSLIYQFKRSYDTTGYHIMIRLKKSSLWWYSKQIYCLVHIGIMQMILCFVSYIVVIMIGKGSCNFEWNGVYSADTGSTNRLSLVVGMPVIVCFTIGVICMVTALAFDAMISVAICESILIGSIFYNKKYMIGRLSMLLSYSNHNEHSYSELESIYICACVIAIMLVLGHVLYDRRDK